MAKKSTLKKAGAWAFIIGIILALIISLAAAFGDVAPWMVLVLAIIGLIVGLLNITPEETMPFLVASAAFLLSFSSLSNLADLLGRAGESLGTFFTMMAIFVAPAAAIVALVAILALVRD